MNYEVSSEDSGKGGFQPPSLLTSKVAKPPEKLGRSVGIESATTKHFYSFVTLFLQKLIRLFCQYVLKYPIQNQNQNQQHVILNCNRRPSQYETVGYQCRSTTYC